MLNVPENDYCTENCGFCVVGKKEGLTSFQTAELSEFRRNQNEIKLLDPNLLACREHEKILEQLAESKAYIDFTQGLDIRLITPDNMRILNKIKVRMLHFAWDDPKQDLTEYFKYFAENTVIKSYRNKSVYVLTNFNSTIYEDWYRIYTLRDMGFSPYVMIYDKEHADREHRRLQRWVNSRPIFYTVKRFEDYK